MIRASLVIVVLLILIAPAGAKEKSGQVREANSPSEVKPGKTALLTTEGGMKYFLRVPKSYTKKKGARLFVFMHGSNMNGMNYLPMFDAKRWCVDDILVCPNGEQGHDPYGQNNFTFESAPKVAEVTRNVAAAFEITRTYIGGHSQGGFVTYSVIMHFPDLYDGAIPMAGDCWMQNEPNLWEGKPDVMEKQKRIAIAVIHGKADPVVSFQQGQHAYDVFNVMGYPKLKLFAPPRLGHQFGLSPVAEAIEWLDAMTGDDPGGTVKLAAAWAKKKEWGDATAAARHVLTMEKAASSRMKAEAVLAKAEKAAAPEVEEMKKAMDEEPPAKWLPKWFTFRRRFGATDAAALLVKRYEEGRESQRAEGKRIFDQAYGLIRGGDKEKGYTLLEAVLTKAPCSYEAYYAATWIEDRK